MNWKITRLSGIDVYVHWSFWILPAWILASALGAGGGWLVGLGTVAFVFAVFGCVVLHELGHALAARHYGIGTHDITLYPIGGVARLHRMPERPTQELAIALAGPLVNVGIAAGLMIAMSVGVDHLLWSFSPIGDSFLAGLMWVNVGLVVFNLLPAFPMDGGRVLRAVLAMILPHTAATLIAGRVGQALALLLGILGLFTTWNLLLVALFVFLAASAEVARARRSSLRPSLLRSDPFVVDGTGGWRPVVDEDGIVWASEVRPYRVREPGGLTIVRRTWLR